MLRNLKCGLTRALALIAAPVFIVATLGLAQTTTPPTPPSRPNMPKPTKPAVEPPTREKPAAKPIEPKSDPYPLETCIVSGEKLGSMGKPVIKHIDGREVRFCCNKCIATFEADKAAFMKKIDDKIIEQQLPHYPLGHCVVMEDDKFDEESSEPVNYVYKNRLVRFCCNKCVKPFTAEPAKYLRKIDEAVIKQQKADYPLEVCPVSGEKLGEMGAPYDKVYGVTLVRFCCSDCAKQFEADPLPHLAKLHEAWKARKPHREKEKEHERHDEDDHDHCDDHGHHDH